MNIRDGKELHAVLVEYALAAYDASCGGLMNRDAFARHARERMAQAAQAISLEAEADRELVEAIHAIDEGPSLVELSMPEDMPAAAPVCGVITMGGNRTITVLGETYEQVIVKAANAAKRIAAEHRVRFPSRPPAYIPTPEPVEVDEPAAGDAWTRDDQRVLDAVNDGKPFAEVRFRTSEDPTRLYSLAEMLRDNDEDAHVCDWLRGAQVGDVFDEYHSARVERVS